MYFTWKKSTYINCIIEFDDGSDWTLSKGLTHANRTSFCSIYKMKWCKGEYNAYRYPLK